MIKRLDQITMARFIDVICGDYSVLLEKEENVDKEILEKCASKLILEYKTIVSPSQVKSMLIDKEEISKENAAILMFRICQTLISLKGYANVKDILTEAGYNVASMSEGQLKNKVDDLLRAAFFAQKRNNEINRSDETDKITVPEDIRSSYYSEVAFLMTYFKMTIDINTITAVIYANIVNRAYLEMKRK